MTFLINPATLPFKHDARMEAVELWRTAERLVAERWAQYSTAGRNQASALTTPTWRPSTPKRLRPTNSASSA
jgi:hypothetical protein